MRALVIALVLAAAPAYAEPLGDLVHDGTSDRAVTSAVGLDGSFAANIGAAFGIASVGDRLRLITWGDATVALGNADLDDFRVRAGARLDLYRHGALFVRGSLAGVVRATRSVGLDAQALATELGVSPGLELGRYHIALDFAIEQTWAAHLAPTPEYRDRVYAMATSGWYSNTERALRAGVGASVELRAVEIAVRAGYAYTGQLDYLPPLYVTAQGAYHF